MGPFRKRKVDHRFFHSHLDWHPPAISIVAVPNFHRRPRRSKFLGRLAFSKQVVDLSFFKSATPPPPSFHESGNLEPFHFLTDLSSNDPRNKSRSRGSPLPDRSRNFALSFRSLVVLHSFFLFFFFFSLSTRRIVRSWETRVFFPRSDPITRNPISVYPSRVRNPNGDRRLKWIRKILKDKRGRLIFFFFLIFLYGFL